MMFIYIYYYDILNLLLEVPVDEGNRQIDVQGDVILSLRLHVFDGNSEADVMGTLSVTSGRAETV